MNNTNHKTEILIVDRSEVVLYILGLELRVNARHDVDLHIGFPIRIHIRQVLAFNYCDLQLLRSLVITDLN